MNNNHQKIIEEHKGVKEKMDFIQKVFNINEIEFTGFCTALEKSGSVAGQQGWKYFQILFSIPEEQTSRKFLKKLRKNWANNKANRTGKLTFPSEIFKEMNDFVQNTNEWKRYFRNFERYNEVIEKDRRKQQQQYNNDITKLSMKLRWLESI